MNPKRLIPLLVALLLWTVSPHLKADLIPVGTARADITPSEPIRLSGYGSRTEPTSEVNLRLNAKALAFGEKDASVLITMDAIGIPEWVTDELADRLCKDTSVDRSRLAICASHTHCAPQLDGVLPGMFLSVLPKEQDEAIKRYTANLLDTLERISREALKNRKPAKVDWAQGKLDFAVNRRVLKDGQWTGFGVQEGAPVDHSMPLMRVTGPNGRIRALLANYACHCTTLGGNNNAIHGDWAGVAQKAIEANHPDAVAMIAIGCGADANPNPRGTIELAEQHGRSVATEVERLLKESEFKPITAAPKGTHDRIPLYFDALPTREEWAERAKENSRWAFAAKVMLSRLETGEGIPDKMMYPVQTWTFGDDLAMVFLAGEVVVDYSLRLKKTFDSKRLWVNAYANDVPCYIASKRIYPQGGYEVDRSMMYYGKPQRLARDTEDRIIDEVLQQLPHRFYSADTKVMLPAPVPKEKALATMHVHDGFNVELVAAEPLTMDPVDIAWGPDLRMWVCEMADYPTGVNGRPGGRIRVLEDRDSDGIYDHSTLFLDRLPYPNSVLPWRDGALIVSAPHILFARDTDGDGMANETKVLFTGFEEGNPQHLVNGLVWGLDNWIHSSHGNGDGGIRSILDGSRLNLNGRDLRLNPDTGALDAQTGQSQHGLVQDDWGNWFGCANSKPGWHFVLADQDQRRNPHVRYPDPKHPLPEIAVAGPVYPTSRTLSRFNDYDKVNRFTSACGMTLYKDILWGAEFSQNVFICEPVHNLVSRMVLKKEGVSFRGVRAPEELQSEFFSSTDNWSRPVNTRTGPDGALYVVDMYRVAIEHPQWIPEDWQRTLRLRDGHDKGRIYRITRKNIAHRNPRSLTGSNPGELADSLSSHNAWTREMAHQLLYWNTSRKTPTELRRIVGARQGEVVDQARLHAMSLLQHLGELDSPSLLSSMESPNSHVRIHAMRLIAHQDDSSEELKAKVRKALQSEDLAERLQAALTLGQFNDRESGRHLSSMLFQAHDEYLIAAALSSLLPHIEICADLVRSNPSLLSSASPAALDGIIRTFLGEKRPDLLAPLVEATASAKNIELLRSLTDALAQSGMSLDKLGSQSDALETAVGGLAPIFGTAAQTAASPKAETARRLASISLLGRQSASRGEDIQLLKSLLQPTLPPSIQEAAFRQLSRVASGNLTGIALDKWSSHSPNLRRQILDTLLNRSSWTLELLEGMKKEPSIIRSLSAAQVAKMQHSSHQGIRSLAKELLSESESDRGKIVASFQPSLSLEGNASKGRQLFTAACAACHKVGDLGKPIGPDLSSLSNKSGEHLLTSILDPNKAIDERYIQYQVQTRDGQELTGVLLQETGTSITLGTVDGSQVQLQRRGISSLNSNGLSLMPEGLEAAFDHQSMADLIRFLQTLGQGLEIEPSKDGSLHLTADRARVSGDSAAFDESLAAMGWIGPSDQVQWQAKILPAGKYAIFCDAGVGEEYEGYPFRLKVGDEVVEGAIEYTRGMNRFRKRKFGNLVLPRNLEQATITLTHNLKSPSVAIREIRLAPAE